MNSRLVTAGVLATVAGALLIVALLLDWWGFPGAFENPEDLPEDAAFSAEAVEMSGQELDADAFEFFEFRDLVWLVAGLVGFGFGVFLLAMRRAPRAAVALTGLLALGAAILVAATLISPPDFGDLAPGEPQPFSIELPLSRDAGGFIALVAAVGVSVSAALAFSRGDERQ